MAIIVRSERSEGINPTPIRAGDLGGEAVGNALQNVGNRMSDLALTMSKEREDLDQFETKMALTRFHSDQTKRQIEYDGGIQGDGRTHTSNRIAEYDQARDTFLKTLPNNERAQKLAKLQLENWRGDFGTRSLNTQRAHINTFKETELLNQTVIGVVPGVTGDRATVEPALKQLDAMIGGSGLPEGRRNAIRSNAVNLIVERYIEQSGIDARVQADQIIKDYQERLKSEPKPEPTEFDTGDADFSGQRGPASVRFNNPGAMYPGPSSRKFGATHTETIGGGHKVAVFPDAVSGAAAQFDLLSSKYTGQTLDRAIAKWSGGNSVGAYLQRIEQATGLKRGDVLTKEMMADPAIAIPLAKIMATHEAGTTYPLSDEQWGKAHQMAIAGGSESAGGDLRAKGSEVAQYSNARGEASEVDIRLGRSDGIFVRGLIHNLDKIDQRVKKLQEEDMAARFVQGAVTGDYPFNPHDDAGRKKVDKAFERSDLATRLFDGEREALNQAVLVSQTLNYVPKTVSEALHGMIKSDNPGKREVGLLAAASILDRRPFAFDATPGGSAVKKDAEYFTALVRGQGLTAEAALKRIDEFNSPEWDKLEGERKKVADVNTQALAESDLRSGFNNSMWIWNRPSTQALGSQNASMMADFRTAYREHYIRTGDDKLAKTLAIGELSRVWGESSVTGAAVLTKYPPESLPYYAAIGGTRQWIQDDLLATVNEWRKAKGQEPVKAGDLAGRLAVIADAQTDREVKRNSGARPGDALAPPSYSLLWRNDDGIDEPIMSTGRDGKVMRRWAGDFTAAEKAHEEKMRGERAKWLDGKTATNPATGERIEYKDGSWKPHDLLRKGIEAVTGRDPREVGKALRGEPEGERKKGAAPHELLRDAVKGMKDGKPHNPGPSLEGMP